MCAPVVEVLGQVAHKDIHFMTKIQVQKTIYMTNKSKMTYVKKVNL